MPASAPIRRLLPSNKITTLKWVCRETGNNYSRHHWDIKVVSVIESVCYIEVLSMSAYFALKIWSRVLGYSAIDPKVYQEIFVRRKKSLKRVIRGYHAYMTTWNALLVNVCNARKNQPTKWTRMQVMWFVLILTGKRRGWWLLQQTYPWLYSCYYSRPVALLPSLQLGNVSTAEVNAAWKFLLIFISVYLKRTLNWLKNKIKT